MTTRRKDNIRFKLMPDGHIHAYQAHKHNSGAGEWHMATSFCRGGVSVCDHRHRQRT